MVMGHTSLPRKTHPDLDCALTIHNSGLATGMVRGDDVPVDPRFPSVKGDLMYHSVTVSQYHSGQPATSLCP